MRHRLHAAILLIACAALAGCNRPEVRTLGELPAPVFGPVDRIDDQSPPPPPPPPPTGETEEQALARVVRNHVQPARAWKWIVVHHSATPGGNAAKFDRFHREKRGWDELGYHFVIGNGTDSRDGQIEIGSRWARQKWGAHAATPSKRFNDYGIGICLVGDFERARPTPAQWRSLVLLARVLCKEYGIPPTNIIGHRDAQATEKKVSTDCPGKNLSPAALREAVARPVLPALLGRPPR